jgi:glycosyltransferase involved in cell wall biosynthesis
MRLGLVVDGHAGFIEDLLTYWRSRYQVEVFSFQEIRLPFSQGRVNGWRLRRALKDFLDRNDVVFFEWAGPLTILASRLDIKTPMVVRLHSWELYEFAPHIMWSKFERIILVSQAMKEKFIHLYPDQSNNTEVVNCGVDLQKFLPTERQSECHIGILCDLIPIKRVYELILSIYDLKRKGYEYKLNIGGRPAGGSNNERYYTAIKRAVEKLDLQEQVTFNGWVVDTKTWFANQDIFISNSYWEGQQVALLEAMASGCYCLSHFWDGAEEILTTEHIYVTENELQQKIIAYSKKNEMEKRRCNQLLRTIACERFDIEITKVRVSEILEKGFVASKDWKL